MKECAYGLANSKRPDGARAKFHEWKLPLRVVSASKNTVKASKRPGQASLVNARFPAEP